MVPADGTIQKIKFMFKKFVNYENMFQEFRGEEELCRNFWVQKINFEKVQKLNRS